MLSSLSSSSDSNTKNGPKVCRWFDEKLEFAGLLPSLISHLQRMKEPPFILLEYDAASRHGQIWLKYQIHQLLSQAANAEERGRLRFVLYIPLAESAWTLLRRRETAAPASIFSRNTARAGCCGGLGKKPSLFAFLRQIGVALSDSPADQRKLWEGGKASLLSKYVSKFADRPALFWKLSLRPSWLSRLIGDVDQTILELASDPEGALNSLRQRGLEKEFLEIVRERYGFDAPFHDPAGMDPGLGIPPGCHRDLPRLWRE